MRVCACAFRCGGRLYAGIIGACAVVVVEKHESACRAPGAVMEERRTATVHAPSEGDRGARGVVLAYARRGVQVEKALRTGRRLASAGSRQVKKFSYPPRRANPPGLSRLFPGSTAPPRPMGHDKNAKRLRQHNQRRPRRAARECLVLQAAAMGTLKSKVWRVTAFRYVIVGVSKEGLQR